MMLPMAEDPDVVRRFVDVVAGRAEVSLLVETPVAASRICEIASIEGVDEVHVGLNDLRLALGLRSHFEVLASDLLVRLSEAVHEAGRAFGVGGVGRRGDASLPIPADLVHAQYPRLRADRAWLARSFLGPDPAALDLEREVALLRQAMDEWEACDTDTLERARDRLRTLASKR